MALPSSRAGFFSERYSEATTRGPGWKRKRDIGLLKIFVGVPMRLGEGYRAAGRRKKTLAPIHPWRVSRLGEGIHTLASTYPCDGMNSCRCLSEPLKRCYRGSFSGRPHDSPSCYWRSTRRMVGPALQPKSNQHQAFAYQPCFTLHNSNPTSSGRHSLSGSYQGCLCVRHMLNPYSNHAVRRRGRAHAWTSN